MTTWDTTHNPEIRPAGCNGRPGDSGRKAHRRKGQEVCPLCLEASNHAKRERNRGQTYPRRLHPCGTPAAARRHRVKGERLCVPCQSAEAADHAKRRELLKMEIANTLESHNEKSGKR